MDILSDIRQPIAPELEQYRRLFDQTLTHPDALLHSVLEHIRSRHGKMMRPMLVLLVAKGLGGINDTALRAAVTLELLHTASLVHDDVVDESNERRGQLSVNAEYDNKVAVLVGDYLLSESLLQASMTGKLQMVEIIANLGKTLSEGEIFQLSNIQSEQISEQAYFRIIRQKTAALFAACAHLGAIAADAAPEQQEQARGLGEIVGICFQIRDDIFDYFDRNVGKPTGADMLEGKLTLPAIYALSACGGEHEMQLARRVKEGSATAADVQALVDFSKRHGGIDYAESVMDNYLQQGLELVDRYADEEVRRALRQYLKFVVKRDI
mgnify:FL=1